MNIKKVAVLLITVLLIVLYSIPVLGSFTVQWAEENRYGLCVEKQSMPIIGNVPADYSTTKKYDCPQGMLYNWHSTRCATDLPEDEICTKLPNQVTTLTNSVSDFNSIAGNSTSNKCDSVISQTSKNTDYGHTEFCECGGKIFRIDDGGYCINPITPLENPMYYRIPCSPLVPGNEQYFRGDLDEVERRCCGDSPQDYGYVHPSTAEMCTIHGWQESAYNDLCVDSSGNILDGTAFNPFVAQSDIFNRSALDGSDACCGDDIFSGGPSCVYDFTDEFLLEIVMECFSRIPCEQEDSKCVLTDSFDQVFCMVNESYFNSLCEGLDFDQCNARENCTFVAADGDLGWLGPSEYNLSNFACFDNSKDPPAGEYYPPVDTPERHFVWRDAAMSVANQILQAANTHFISNSEEWFYCNADGQFRFGGTNAIPEYGTFDARLGAGLDYCSTGFATVLAALFNPDNENIEVVPRVWDCTNNSLSRCREEAAKIPYDGFCWDGDDGSRRVAYSAGRFWNECVLGNVHACYVWDGDGYVNLEDYQSYSAFCANPENEDNFICRHSGSLSPVTRIEREECFDDIDNCVEATVPDKSCDEIHGELGFDYIGDERKICSSNQYCQYGELVRSDENQTYPTCCLGQNAVCRDYQPGDCDSIGGEVHPDPSNMEGYACLGGPLIDATDEQCCLGMWVSEAEVALQNVQKNESFICYQRGEQNYLQECCGVQGCENARNILGEHEPPVIPHHVYSYAGFSYNFLFRDLVNSGGAYAERYAGVRVDNPIVLNHPQRSKLFHIHDWSGFDFFEFDVIYSAENVMDQVILFDGSGNHASFSFSDYTVIRRGSFRPERIAIPLNVEEGVDYSNITMINITVSSHSNVNVVLDNLFLRTENDSSPNSETRYCSGYWGKWVENLDGPQGDKGFFEEENPSFSDIGPYRDACNAVASFGWTGTLCCGDDTRGEYGEFFVDSAGMCWNGTTVKHDQTLALALTRRHNLRPLEERSLLYFRTPSGDGGYVGKPYFCNASDEIHPYDFNVNFSFDGKNPYDEYTMFDELEFVQPFSIMGSWFCRPEQGWVKLYDINRVEVLASTLVSLGEEAGNYSLFCGDHSEVSNYIPEGDAMVTVNDMTGNMCVLRIGDNQEFPDEVFVGLEIDRLTRSFEDYKQVLSFFTPYHNDVLDGLDCSNAPLNVDSSALYSDCGFNDQGIKFYYNLPLNLVILTSDEIPGGFLRRMWDGFVRFFRNLFAGASEPEGLPGLPVGWLGAANITDVYAAQQGDKSIRGLKQFYQDYVARVDYHNVATNVSFLEEAIGSGQGVQSSYYSPDSSQQTIFLNSTLPIPWNYWTLLTSQLRLGD